MGLEMAELTLKTACTNVEKVRPWFGGDYENMFGWFQPVTRQDFLANMMPCRTVPFLSIQTPHTTRPPFMRSHTYQKVQHRPISMIDLVAGHILMIAVWS